VTKNVVVRCSRGTLRGPMRLNPRTLNYFPLSDTSDSAYNAGNIAGWTTLPEREEERLGRFWPIVASKASREGAPAVSATPPRTPSTHPSVASGAPPATEVPS